MKPEAYMALKKTTIFKLRDPILYLSDLESI